MRAHWAAAVTLLVVTTLSEAAPPAHKLLVLSVDGLDWRYLRDRDALGLRIPNMRRLLQEGQYANGVVGVWPTITWPSHTSILTGVRPDQHGIENNPRPKSENTRYPWNANSLKAPALWQAAHDHGLKTASVTWPVTVGASIDYNLPEFFRRRQGGSMDLEAIASKATPDLVPLISRAYPSFPQQWMDDRTRTLAVLYLMHEVRPDLLLVHLVDLDSEAHDQGPFTENANAILERTDELIGQILGALPPDTVLALLSDHGFERVDHTANLRALLAQKGIVGDVQPLGGIVVTKDAKVAEVLRQMQADPANQIGREIPHSELIQYAPKLADAVAAFEPAEHIMFGREEGGPYLTAPYEKGNHGFWPTHHDYRSIFVLWGPGIAKGSGPEMQMIDIASQLAKVLGIPSPASPSRTSP